ncbi:hypothetical protein GQ457_16G018350 [Hibiscus cannabinus]
MIQRLCENSMPKAKRSCIPRYAQSKAMCCTSLRNLLCNMKLRSRIKSQQYCEAVLKQLRSQRLRNHQGRMSAQIFPATAEGQNSRKG